MVILVHTFLNIHVFLFNSLMSGLSSFICIMPSIAYSLFFSAFLYHIYWLNCCYFVKTSYIYISFTLIYPKFVLLHKSVLSIRPSIYLPTYVQNDLPPVLLLNFSKYFWVREAYLLVQKFANFFSNRLDNKYIRLCRPYSLCHNCLALLL